MKIVIAILLAGLAFTTQAQPVTALKKDMYGIASDATEGRFTGSPGYLKAAKYVAQQLKASGLKTTFQRVSFIWDNYDASSLSVGGETFRHSGGNFIVLQRSAQQAGKWMVLQHRPDSSETEALVKQKVAGAIVLPDEAQAKDWETTVIRQYRFGYMHYAIDYKPVIAPLTLILVSPHVAKQLKAGLPKVNFKYKQEQVSGYNVIGRVAGTDKRLNDQTIVAGAHLDHIGRLGNHIYNGANDDASGCVALLVAAKTIAAHPVKRPLMFVFYCGEELNLLGSRYFTEHPPLPIKNILMNINLEQVGSKHRSERGIWAVATPGFEQDFYSSGKALPAQYLKYSPMDSLLNEVSNTDTYNFLNKNVPSVLLSSGGFDEHHSPLDKIALIDFPHLRKVALLLNKFIRMVGNN
ncbi:MAG: M28 family peptidase [Bacteroidota bacterium]